MDNIQYANFVVSAIAAISVYMYMTSVRRFQKKEEIMARRIDELETLYAITRVFDTCTDLNELLTQVSRIIAHGFGVDMCAVMLYSQTTGALELQASYPEKYTTERNRYTMSPEDGLAGEVFRSGHPIVCRNLQENAEVLRRIHFRENEKAIGVYPLENDDERFGVLVLTCVHTIDVSSGIDQAMEAVASTVSMVIANAQRHEDVSRSAQIDELTGLYNRAFFYDALEREVRKAAYTGQSVYVLVLDIDRFKSINDTHGHLIGDRVLEEIGKIINRNTRQLDVAARYGGEEFAIVMPNSCYSAAEYMAERIRRSVEKLTQDYIEFREFEAVVTMSVGIACYPHCSDNPKGIVDMADKRMYAAKRTGGNRYLYE